MPQARRRAGSERCRGPQRDGGMCGRHFNTSHTTAEVCLRGIECQVPFEAAVRRRLFFSQGAIGTRTPESAPAAVKGHLTADPHLLGGTGGSPGGGRVTAVPGRHNLWPLANGAVGRSHRRDRPSQRPAIAETGQALYKSVTRRRRVGGAGKCTIPLKVGGRMRPGADIHDPPKWQVMVGERHFG